MTQRLTALALCVATATFFLALTAAPASADPPPWSAAYHKQHKHRGTSCDHPSHFSPAGRAARYDDGRCNQILARAEKARHGLARWQGTGRHKDAQRAWREVLAKTPQRLRECRMAAQREAFYPRASYDDRGYDLYDDRYDPYSSVPYGQSFDLKRDWPFLLGNLFGQYGNP